MREPTARIDSSLTTYNSCEIAAAVKPVLRTTDEVFENKLFPGKESMIDEAFSEGAGFCE